MVTPELVSFISAQLKNGTTEEALRADLIHGGWSPSDIEEALLKLKQPEQNTPVVNTHVNNRGILIRNIFLAILFAINIVQLVVLLVPKYVAILYLIFVISAFTLNPFLIAILIDVVTFIYTISCYVYALRKLKKLKQNFDESSIVSKRKLNRLKRFSIFVLIFMLLQPVISRFIGNAVTQNGPFKTQQQSNTESAPNNKILSSCDPSGYSSIYVLSPVGGEIYKTGNTITVSWKTCYTPNNFQVSLMEHTTNVPYDPNKDSTGRLIKDNINYYPDDSIYATATNPITSYGNDTRDGWDMYSVSIPLKNDTPNAGSNYYLKIISQGGVFTTTIGGNPYTRTAQPVIIYSDGLFTITP